MQGHRSAPLAIVCMESKCATKNLLCCYCLEADHLHHKTQSLRRFIEENDNTSYDRTHSNQLEDAATKVKTIKS